MRSSINRENIASLSGHGSSGNVSGAASTNSDRVSSQRIHNNRPGTASSATAGFNDAEQIGAAHSMMRTSSFASTSLKPPLSPELKGGRRKQLTATIDTLSSPYSQQQVLQPSHSQSLGIQKQKLEFNNAMDFIINEVEAIYTDIAQQTPLLKNLPEHESSNWIAQKQRTISDLQKQLQAQPYSKDVPYCETLMQKCSRSLRLAGGSPSNSVVRHGGNHGGSMASGSSQFYGTNSSVVKARAEDRRRQGGSMDSDEFLREKEEKLDKDFMRLLDRYNHSKELIDQLASTQSGAGSAVNLRNNNNNTAVPSYVVSPSRSFVSESRQDDERKNSKRSGVDRKKQQQQYDEIDVDVDDERRRSVDRNLHRLKETMEVGEAQMKKKIFELRTRNKELKSSLKEYVEKCQGYANAMSNKDREIENFEYELREAQQDILLNLDSVKELKVKEAGWMQMEAELRQQVIELKAKLLRKKNKLTAAREQQEAERVSNSERIRSQDEIIARQDNDIKLSQSKLAEESGKVANLNQSMAELRADIDQKCLEFKQFYDEMEEARQVNSQLQAKHEQEVTGRSDGLKKIADMAHQIEQLQVANAGLNEKITKLKVKHAASQEALVNQHAEEIAKKKLKINTFKNSLARSNESLQETENKRLVLSKQLENLTIKCNDIEKQLQSESSSRAALEEHLEVQKGESAKLKLEKERLQNLVSSLENRNNQLETGQLEDAKTINNLNQDLNRIDGELQERSLQFQQADEYIQVIKAKNDEELTKFEEKLEEVIMSLKSVSDENAILKAKENDGKKLLVQLEEQLETYKEKYLKVKHSNKSLLSQTGLLEQKLNECLSERQLERIAIEKEREKQTRQENTKKNKLRVIDEIQTMIKSHSNISQAFKN